MGPQKKGPTIKAEGCFSSHHSCAVLETGFKTFLFCFGQIAARIKSQNMTHIQYKVKWFYSKGFQNLNRRLLKYLNF